jgi:hypothetical protein
VRGFEGWSALDARVDEHVDDDGGDDDGAAD